MYMRVLKCWSAHLESFRRVSEQFQPWALSRFLSVCFTNTSFTSSHSFSISLSLFKTKESSHPIRRGRSTVLIKSGRSLAVREGVIRSLYIHLGQNFSGRLRIQTGAEHRHGDVDTHTPPGGIAYVHNTRSYLLRNMISRNFEKDGLSCACLRWISLDCKCNCD